MAASKGSSLPVVDLAPFFVARGRATAAVREACLSSGLFHVVNHGVPRELMARALELEALFFALELVVQVLSNGKFRSAMHRVVRKPAAHRYSLVFFFHLHDDKWVEPLPQFAGDVGEPPRYRGFKYGEYLQLRRKRTHPPSSHPENIVDITHYAI